METQSYKGGANMSKTIGQRLRELRKELDITQEELSKRCDVTKQRINYFELDKGLPTIPTLQKLAKGLGCTIFDIVDEPWGRKDAVCIHSTTCKFYNRKIEGN